MITRKRQAWSETDSRNTKWFSGQDNVIYAFAKSVRESSLWIKLSCTKTYLVIALCNCSETKTRAKWWPMILPVSLYTVEKAQVATRLLQACYFAVIEPISKCVHIACSAAGCQQAWCKLIVKTFYPQTRCNLLQQLAAILQTSSGIKSDFHRLDVTYETNWLDEKVASSQWCFWRCGHYANHYKSRQNVFCSKRLIPLQRFKVVSSMSECTEH